MNATATHISTFMTESCAMPFCKGCGHSHVLRAMNEALVKLQLNPSHVSLVTDIGCIGLADAVFPIPHTVHTTHGRSTAFATGIEVADAVLDDSSLKSIVLIGDGGAMIGLLHLVNAALLNVDITVILCNNFLFGMTGGQHSAFSPLDFITATTPKGNIISPLDICKVMIDAHAGFVARKLATDKDVSETIAEAIRYPGFALVEIVELCTEYGTKKNQLSGNQLRQIVEAHGQQIGILKEGNERTEFGPLYTAKFSPRHEVNANLTDTFLKQAYAHQLQSQTGIIVAGSAGERVQSSASLFCETAVKSGLYTTQKNDNPVTQGSGFSLSEICISPSEIHYTAIDQPDVVIVASNDGLRELAGKELFNRMTPSTLVIIDSALKLPETDAEVLQLPLRATCGAAKAIAAALGLYIELTQIFPPAAFYESLGKGNLKNEPFFSEKFFALVHSSRERVHQIS